MSRDKITSLVDSVANMLLDNEKIAIPLLAVKLRKIADSHTYDQTLIAMTNIISKMEDNNKLLISKAEFKNLYNRLYTKNTKFAEYFKEELGITDAPVATKTASKKELPISNTYDQVSDPVLANALASAFDRKIPLKLFSKEVAHRAVVAVASNLDAWNLKASKLEADGGNSHFIIVKADYDTPKGLTSILVPVEVARGKVLPPSVFMGNTGPQELNHVNIKSYISSYAGTKLMVRANDIVDVLTSAVTDNTDVSDIELALTKLNATRETSAPFFSDQVLGQVPQKQEKNLEITLPKLGQFQSFADKFESPIGYANFKFGTDKVNLGRDVIVRTLASFGISNSQISIANADDTVIVYAVSIGGKTAFTVPVKFANNRLLNPDVLICNGSVLSFSKDSIGKLFAKNAMDFKAAAVASPGYGLKPSDLIANVREAMVENNYAKAEDALNILAESGDPKAYQVAFSAYMSGLSMTKTASDSAPEVKCSRIVTSSSSQHPCCGHTGLPLHKVYQDKHGICHPAYRKGMEESTDSGAYFMNSKIFG